MDTQDPISAFKEQVIRQGISAGIRDARKKRHELFDLVFQKIKDSPLLFIQLWCIPPLLFHLSKLMFNSVTPVLFFLMGCAFMVLMETFLIIKVFDQPERQHKHARATASGGGIGQDKPVESGQEGQESCAEAIDLNVELRHTGKHYMDPRDISKEEAERQE